MNADLEAARAHYDQLASSYDDATRLINGIRNKTISALQLQPGDAVLDVGCGTGYCLPMLSAAVGSSGRVAGFEPAPAMLAVARQRAVKAGLTNITLLEASAELVELPFAPNALLFSYTHDLMQSVVALQNLFRQSQAGARIAATSTKLYAPWLVPANWWLRWRHRGYITDFDGFEAPWSLLSTYLDDFHVETGPFTQHYVATGSLKREYSQVQAA